MASGAAPGGADDFLTSPTQRDEDVFYFEKCFTGLETPEN